MTAAASGLEMAAGTGGNGRQGEELAAFSERGLLGLAAASAASALAVSEPPPWLDRNAYSVAISGLFFAGVTQVVVVVVVAASVSAPTAGAAEARPGGSS